MVKFTTLAKLAVGLSFPVVGMAFLARNTVAKNFAQQSYYQEALKLLKEYPPIMEKLGDPVNAKAIDISDSFNYQDEQIARAKIPVKGEKNSGYLLVYASRQGNRWNLDSLEMMSETNKKFKFYDSSKIKNES